MKLARAHSVLKWVVTTSRHKLYSWNGQRGQPQQLYSYFQVHINRGSFILNESIADIITTDISEKVTLGFTDCGPYAYTSSRECYVIAFSLEDADKIRSTKRTESSCLLL